MFAKVTFYARSLFNLTKCSKSRGKKALVLIWQKKCSEYQKSDPFHDGFGDASGK